MKMLNLACGCRYHTDWINTDFYKISDDVKAVNILKGLPFQNNMFDVAYCSHFLEHLSLGQAKNFFNRSTKNLERKWNFLE